MVLIGISFIIASFVVFCLRCPASLPSLFGHLLLTSSARPSTEVDADADADADADLLEDKAVNKEPRAQAQPQQQQQVQQHLTQDTEQTTPRPMPAESDVTIPSLALSVPTTDSESIGSPSRPDHTSPPKTIGLEPPDIAAPGLMAPPPAPKTCRPMPTLAPTRAQPSSSLLRTRTPPPVPDRSALSRPSTHPSVGRQTTPSPSSRARTAVVRLAPGHSPMDWARLAQSPTSDLRGLPPGTPYLRVTPSQLRLMTGRRGRDAWSALGGKVYNITPYMHFHPGGEPELLRAAARDATSLFADVHPWVNYETMLSACLVGILVGDH